jgi:acyl-coenzyme A synthetase/AMP-(fatty) acid ligase
VLASEQPDGAALRIVSDDGSDDALTYAELPKTISGKIRRVELRTAEQGRDQRSATEFREEDFPSLKG